jgi:nicotinate-nucleotide adenylyltransferase
MRFGIFGGTFDPPHLGHAMACLWALETGEVDRVLMIPTARHAFGKQPAAGFDHRLAMCRLAARHLGEHVEISDIEGRREGVSYMVDTLRALAADRPGATFRLLVGTDIVGDVPKWRESAEILRLAPLLVLPRLLPGDRPRSAPRRAPRSQQHGGAGRPPGTWQHRGTDRPFRAGLHHGEPSIRAGLTEPFQSHQEFAP